MNTSVRARYGAGGFSFVELLVTIIIAGIAFAAMVPLFVQAQEQNVGDNFRNVALQLAQDKIEKVRQLDYDQIEADNLIDPDFADGMFGTEWVYFAGQSSGQRTFYISYDVALVPDGANLGEEQYKTVKVDVYWDAPPKPVKHAVLQTVVYKQYAGPQIDRFYVSPLEVQSQIGPDVVWITNMPIVLDAYVADADFLSAAKVHFSIADELNVVQAQKAVLRNDSNLLYRDLGNGHFQWTYGGPMPDGLYVFSATSESDSGFSGNTASLRFTVEQGASAAPTGVTLRAMNQAVRLDWTAPAAGDIDHYEIYRGDNGSGSEAIPGSGQPTGKTTTASTTWTDTDGVNGLVNGKVYYYRVYAVDRMGNISLASTEVFIAPTDVPDNVFPSAPVWVTASATVPGPVVSFAWNAASDNIGIAGYLIEHSFSYDNGITWTVPEQLQPGQPLAFGENVGYGAQVRYLVAAVDLSGNTTWSAPITIQTNAAPSRSLYVYNTITTGNSSMYAYLTSSDNARYYNQAGGLVGSASVVTVPKGTNKGKTWTLPAGTYNVHYALVPSAPFPPASQKPVDLTQTDLLSPGVGIP